MTVKIYHNPRCSKSRQTLGILREHRQPFEVIAYLESPPDESELRHVIKSLGINAHELLRKGEPEYTRLALAEASEEVALQAMLAHPILIERPIVVSEKGACIGRPPESILEILD